MFSHIKSILKVTWRRFDNVSRASWTLLEENVTTYQESLRSYLEEDVARWHCCKAKNVITPLQLPRNRPANPPKKVTTVPPPEGRRRPKALLASVRDSVCLLFFLVLVFASIWCLNKNNRTARKPAQRFDRFLCSAFVFVL